VIGDRLSPWSVAPSGDLRLCIVVLPLATPKWFEKLRGKVILAALFGVPALVRLAVAFGAAGRERISATAIDPNVRTHQIARRDVQ
jgi:hypothetical protein